MKAVVAEKRLVDSLLALVVFLMALPFFVILPVLIKVTSRGPVFYKARRLGKNGRTIMAWKFRSMYTDADRRLAELLEADAKMKKEFEKDFKLKNDPRVTPLGKIMRRLSLDELPQLFNVFAGDMALVGPRPIVEAEIPYYGKDYDAVSHVKPGITGLWQTSGRSDTGYTRRVALDLYYVLNWSPWLDIWIVMRTVWKVLFMQGAY
jgi:Undecaprenyl-phosphate galactose phosphotransferase WbaP